MHFVEGWADSVVLRSLETANVYTAAILVLLMSEIKKGN